MQSLVWVRDSLTRDFHQAARIASGLPPLASQKTQQGCESERIQMQSGEDRGEISGLGEWSGNHGRCGFCPAIEAGCPRGLSSCCALWTPTCFRRHRWCRSQGHLSPSGAGEVPPIFFFSILSSPAPDHSDSQL